MNLFGIISILISIVSVYLTYKYKKKLKLSLSSLSNEVVISDLSKIKTSLKDASQDKYPAHYNILKLSLINSGTEALKMINFKTIPNIQFDDKPQIIEYKIYSSNENVKLRLIRNNDFELFFDYIDPKDMISIEIYYLAKDVCTGSIKAKIIGGNKINHSFKSKIENDEYIKIYGVALYTYYFFAMLIMIFSTSLGIIFVISLYRIFHFNFLLNNYLGSHNFKMLMIFYLVIAEIMSIIYGYKIAIKLQTIKYFSRLSKFINNTINRK